ELVMGAMERFLRDLERNALDLEDHATGADDRDPAFDAALTGTHSSLGGLLGERVVREDAGVDLSELLHRARDGGASGFDLTRGEPARRGDLETVVTERHFVATLRLAAEVALLHLAELRTFWRKHRHGS